MQHLTVDDGSASLAHAQASLSVSSGLGPPNVNQLSLRMRRRSSCAFCWLRVSFFFFLTGGVAMPFALSSAPLPAGVALVDAAGVCAREESAGVLLPLPFGDLTAKASSTTATLPLRKNI